MSQQYNNENRFVLFPNNRKETDKHPDLTGTINIDGRDHFFDAWITWNGGSIGRINGKIGQAKTKGKVSGVGNSGGTRPRKQLGEDQRPAPRGDASGGYPDDDDIPFAPIIRRALW